MKCPNCGKELLDIEEYIAGLDKCEVEGCNNLAEYEGWYRVRDFTGLPTGLIQLRRVCELHTSLLIANEKKEESESK